MIELYSVAAGYRQETVLRDISLAIPKGKLLTVVGVNGSGKSTLLKTIVGIVPLSSGTVTVNGTDRNDLSRQDTAKRISYLAQGKSVPDMTVRQMVLHGRFPHLRYPRRYSAKDREIAKAALCRMGIADLADRSLPSLSGGMRQKAYIAMALAQDTDYLLLDEPTTYLDIAGQLELMKTLRTLADSGKGVVTVLHDLPLAFRFSDSIAVLNDGTIAVCDTPESVSRSGIIETVFGVGLKKDEADNAYSYRYL